MAALPGAPQRLRCEFVSNPFGIATPAPRLTWWVNDPRPAEIQSAFEVLAASSLEALREDDGNLWSSGVVDGGGANEVTYDGEPLAAGLGVWWKVRTFDSDGMTSPWSEPAQFEMALNFGLEHGDRWPADNAGVWISTPLMGSRQRSVQVAALRREFELTNMPERARLYIACLGDYRLEINGVEVPESVSANLWSQFDAVCYFQTYDVTEYLALGHNAIGLLLADGCYAGELPGLGRACYGDAPKVRVSLAMDMGLGKRLVIDSDQRWHWKPSWILSAEPFSGEHVDRRQHDHAWSSPGLSERDWQIVAPVDDPGVALRPQTVAPLGVRQVLRPLHMPAGSPGAGAGPRDARDARGARGDRRGRLSQVYDFGTHIVGRVRVELHTRAVDEITISYALEDGSFHATDTYTSAGKGGESYCASFTMHSFRYARVTFSDAATEVRDVLALRIALGQAPALNFRSDHATLNNLFDVIQGSLHDVAQAVPMRGIRPSERLPDLAYAFTWVPLLARDMRAHGLILKWLRDAVDRLQGPPTHRNARLEAFNLDADMEIVEMLARGAWALYRHQGDRAALELAYGVLRVEALAFRHAHPQLLRDTFDSELYGEGVSGALVASASFYGVLRIVARMAAVLGSLGDAELLETLAGDVRSAIRRRYLTLDGHLTGDDQSAYVAALYHGVLEEDERRPAQARLFELLQSEQYQTDVVPALVRCILPVLTEAGRLDMAYMVLLQTTDASWLGTILKGGGHIARAPGAYDAADVGIGQWLIDSLIGIALDEDYSQDRTGYRSVRVQPMPPLGKQFLAGAPVGSLEATLRTVQGEYAIGWRIGDDSFELTLTVPPSCMAEIIMPDGIVQRVSSGSHHFTMSFGAGGDGVPTLLDMTEPHLDGIQERRA